MTTALRAIEDLPEFAEFDSPDFGASLEWIADDLFTRDYQGLLRHRDWGLVVYRNADLRALAIHEAVSHQDVPPQEGETSMPGWEDFMRVSTFGMQPPVHRPAKAIIGRRLSSTSMSRFMDIATETADDLIGKATEREEIDFIPDFVKPFGTRFWSQVLGLTSEDVDRSSRALNDFFLPFVLHATEDQLMSASRGADEYMDVMTAALEREMSAGTNEILAELAADYEVMGELGRPSRRLRPAE